MTWAAGSMVSFDIESTGIDPETARIVTACVALIEADGTVDVREWLVNPGISIPQGAIDVHGVTNERAQADGIQPATAAAQIFAVLDQAWSAGIPVVIMNSSYDLTLLDRELRRHCDTFLGKTGPVIDPMVIDRAVDKYRKGKRTLTDLCAHYQVKLEGAHTAAGDCLAAARVAWRLAQTYPEKVGSLSLSELHAAQEAWRADWAAGFIDYLRQQGKDASDVSAEWPLRRVA